MSLLQLLYHQHGYSGEYALLGAVSTALWTGDHARGEAEEKEKGIPLGGILRHRHGAQHRGACSFLQVRKTACFWLCRFFNQLKSRLVLTLFPLQLSCLPSSCFFLRYTHIGVNGIVCGRVSVPCVLPPPHDLCPWLCFHTRTLCHLC